MPDYSKLDHWSLKAQSEGYPARSVYKLKEMDEKFGLMKHGKGVFKVLDLGAAPGSWSLYVLRKLSRFSGAAPESAGGEISPDAAGGRYLLLSVDLAPLSERHGLFETQGFIFLRGDFTLPETRETILSHGPYNLVLSDAAPSTTGNRSIDTLRSLCLAESALDYASTALAKGGKMAVKVFQGGDTASLLKSIRGVFETAKSFKPDACRAESFETYYLGLGKK